MSGAFAAGTTVGRYLIEKEIGRGGMGVVYRALDPTLNRAVALKVLAQHLGETPTAQLRFQREATSIAKLKHPNIALVYEFGEHGGLPFLALEWVEGRTLKALMEGGPLPVERALRIFDQLAEALDYAHEHGVIHRDLKPGNIIVSPSAHATLVDFGLAWMASEPAITMTGATFGTPLYISPEQIRGEELDGRSDLYSLAVVLYEMLVGKPPFTAESTPALLHHHLYTQPLPISEHIPTISPVVEAALQKALSKNRQERFATAREFSAALRGEVALPTAEQRLTLRMNGYPQELAPASEAAAPVPAPLFASRRWITPLAITMAVLGVMGLLGAFALNNFGQFNNVAQITLTARMGETHTAEALAAVTPEPPITETATEAFTEEAPSTEPPVSDTQPAPTLIPTPVLNPPREGGWWPMVQGGPDHSSYVYDEGGLQRLNVEPIWRRIRLTGGRTGAVIGGGLVFMGTYEGWMRAFKWDDGLQEWERELGSEIVSDPVLFANDSGGRIMLALEDRRLVGLDAWNGEVMWELGQEVISGSVVGGVTLGEDGVAYGATDEGRAYAIDPLSGEITGQADLSAYGSFNQPPAVGQNAIYVTDWNQSVYAVNPYDGDVFWQSDIRGNATTPVTLAAGQNRLFVGTDEGFVHALWIDSGGQAWAPQRVSGQVVGLAQDGTRLYATVADGTVYAWFIETGETAWAINTGTTQLNTHPLTDGQHVLVITPRREGDEESGDLRYLRAEDGLEETDWRIKLYDGGYRAPAPAGGWLFVPAWQVYGFGPP